MSTGTKAHHFLKMPQSTKCSLETSRTSRTSGLTYCHQARAMYFYSTARTGTKELRQTSSGIPSKVPLCI